jgi:hypothetical protein
MTPIRMRSAMAIVAGAVGFILAAGCDGSSRQPAAGQAQVEADKAAAADVARGRGPADPTAKVPKPDLAMIGYDPGARRLVLYRLPDAAAKWMLHVPEQPKGVPVNEIHQFMEEVDLDRVAVFYTTATGQASPRVTLREILSARDTRSPQ